MIKPETIAEKLLFATVRLQTETGVGTGFIFNINTADNKIIPVIITNKHVVNYSEKQKANFSLHKNEGGLPTDDNVEIIYDAEWTFHSDKEIDLCCTPLAPLLHQLKTQHGTEIFYIPIDETLIWSDEKLAELSVTEDILMVGYPTGLFDIKHNLPLVRSGITSSHPALDFLGKGIAVIDMACFPGSSGSPVFIVNNNGYSDKKGNVYMGSSRVIFLGVLFGGPSYNSEGQIEIKEVPTQQTIVSKNRVMINLGYYVKAREILALKQDVLRKLKL